jgi:hypothetical protein
MTRAIPTSMKIGKTRYSVKTMATRQERGNTVHGSCWYAQHRIDVATSHQGQPIPPKEVADTFWHETTHAILNEMGHHLRSNEPFVTEFSRLLSRAIDSARFK